VGVTGADVVAVIDDHAVAPSIIFHTLHDSIGSRQHRLALVRIAGKTEIPAILTVGTSGMSPRTHVGIDILAEALAVALVVAELAVARPRLGHFPLVFGIERNLEVGRDVAQRERLDAVLLVGAEVADFVAGAVGVLHLLIVEVVVGIRGLARRSERENHAHDEENDVTHDVSFSLVVAL